MSLLHKKSSYPTIFLSQEKFTDCKNKKRMTYREKKRLIKLSMSKAHAGLRLKEAEEEAVEGRLKILSSFYHKFFLWICLLEWQIINFFPTNYSWQLPVLSITKTRYIVFCQLHSQQSAYRLSFKKYTFCCSTTIRSKKQTKEQRSNQTKN